MTKTTFEFPEDFNAKDVLKLLAGAMDTIGKFADDDERLKSFAPNVQKLANEKIPSRVLRLWTEPLTVNEALEYIFGIEYLSRSSYSALGGTLADSYRLRFGIDPETNGKVFVYSVDSYPVFKEFLLKKGLM